MDYNLLKSLNNYITPDLITQASDILGETETGVYNVMSSAIPTLLTGLLNHTKDASETNEIMNLVNHKDLDFSNVLTNLPKQLTNSRDQTTLEAGTRMLNLLFGNKQSGLFDILGNETKIKKTSVSQLMLMAAPMVLAYIRDSGFDADSLTKTLIAEKEEIKAMTPVGLHALLNQGNKPKPVVKIRTKTNVNTKKKKIVVEPENRWIVPFLVFVSGLLIFYIICL